MLTTSDAAGTGRLVIPKVSYWHCWAPCMRVALHPLASDTAAPPAGTACSAPRLCVQSLAEAHLPHLEEPSGILLEMADTDGGHHSFRYRFWINNQSRCTAAASTHNSAPPGLAAGNAR